MTTPISTERKKGKLADIEVLRAVAILLVLVDHLRRLITPTGRNADWLFFWGGVDLFFCISGFVIARSLLAIDLEGKKGALAFIEFAVPFWIRRFFRLTPAAVTWLLIVMILSIFFNRSEAFGTFRNNLGDAVSAMLQVANFHFLDTIYFHLGTHGVNGIYWSLSLEEQFYLIFPFALFFIPRKTLLGIIGVLIVIQFPQTRNQDEPLWFVRTDALLLGILIAAIPADVFQRIEPTFLAGKRLRAYGLLALMTFFIAILTTPVVTVTFSTGLLAIVCAILVFCASYDKCYVMPEGPFKVIMLYIGSRSYSIYLVHTPIILLTVEIFHRLGYSIGLEPLSAQPVRTTAALIAVGLILLFSEMTYRCIETPMRRLGVKKSAEFKAAGRSAILGEPQ